MDTLKSMNYENNTPIKSGFWVEQLTNFHPKMVTKMLKKSASFGETMGFKCILEYNWDLFLDTPKS